MQKQKKENKINDIFAYVVFLDYKLDSLEYKLNMLLEKKEETTKKQKKNYEQLSLFDDEEKKGGKK